MYQYSFGKEALLKRQRCNFTVPKLRHASNLGADFKKRQGPLQVADSC